MKVLGLSAVLGSTVLSPIALFLRAFSVPRALPGPAPDKTMRQGEHLLQQADGTQRRCPIQMEAPGRGSQNTSPLADQKSGICQAKVFRGQRDESKGLEVRQAFLIITSHPAPSLHG